MNIITYEDINRYITVIRINFENAYKAQNEEEKQILYKTWYSILKDYPKEVVDKAVINAIKRAEFAPRIGTIVTEIEKMQEACEKPDTELWAELTDKLHKVESLAYKLQFNFVEKNGLTQGENARREIEKIFTELSPELKEYCNNVNGLINLSRNDSEQIGYERGRFIKLMPTIRQRAKTRGTMSNSLAVLVQGVSEKMLSFGSAESDGWKQIK